MGVAFPTGGIETLRELGHNNNKAWFEANKARYTREVLEPAQAIVADLGQRLQEFAPGVRWDTATNGRGSLMRFYRDVRFSKDKSPYKSNVAMMFWHGPGKKMESPGFGVQINADEGTWSMGGIFGFPKELVPTYRDAVVSQKWGPALDAAIGQIPGELTFGASEGPGDRAQRSPDAGYRLEGAGLKRVPRGYDAEHPRAELLKFTGLWASAPPIPLDVVVSDDFTDHLIERFRAVAPLERWVARLMGVYDE